MQGLLHRLEEGEEPDGEAGQEKAEAQEQGQRQGHHQAGQEQDSTGFSVSSVVTCF